MAPPRVRLVTLLTSGVLLAAPLTAAAAPTPSDDPGGRQHTVERRIAHADHDLDESSAQVRRAAVALLRSRAQLGEARRRLTATRSALAAAQRRDDRLATSLAAAVARLDAARGRLADARRTLADQRVALGRLAASTYQNGDPSLLGLSMVLTSQDPAALTGQLGAVNSVMDRETVVLARLQASRTVRRVEAREVSRARDAVARQRRAAAATLVRRRQLEQRAAAVETSVRRLVAGRAAARRQAERARAVDRAQLAALQRERRRIAAVLARRAAAARARAAAASPHGTGPLLPPVAGPVTSAFGWRIHPIFGYRSLHDGIDLGAGCGTPVRAAAGGQVLEEYASAAWGNRLVIDHGFHRGVQLATISNHLSGYAVGVGAHVRRGQVVGYVGTTGWSTGCHLHFTVLQNGVAVDPERWF